MAVEAEGVLLLLIWFSFGTNIELNPDPLQAKVKRGVYNDPKQSIVIL